MTGLIIFIVVAIIGIGIMIYREKTGSIIGEEKVLVPAPQGGDGGVSDAVVFMGESNPSAPDCGFACNNPLVIREYSPRRTPLQRGDTLYNGEELQEPTNGGDNWIALTKNASVQVVRVDRNGKVTELCVC